MAEQLNILLEEPILLEIQTNDIIPINAIGNVTLVPGPPGPTGPQGAQGIQGIQGDSAYQVAVSHGFSGTEQDWLDSLIGADGNTILFGNIAPTNSQGVDDNFYIDLITWNFYQKKKGSWALQGKIKGDAGADGINGTNGTNGTNGVGVPAGGTAGQILTKIDATNYNTYWQDNFADWTSVVKHTVKNNGLAGTISKGTAVYLTGADGTNMLVGKASNTSEATSSKTMGLMQSDITTTGGTQTGFVITEGLISGLNTAGQTAGDPVWLGVNGALIYGLANKPYAPAHLVFIGIVTKVSAGSGEIFVKVQNGFELREIHDVDLITNTPTNNQLLSYNSTTGLWANKSVTTADIAASTNKNYVTDAQAIVIGNTSGTNSGDNAVNSLYSGLAASKQDTLVSGTNIKTVEGQSILGTGNIDITKTDVGLGSVDNTSDLSKPISTATQTALNAKQNTITNSDSITEGATNLFLTSAERTKLTNTSGTNSGDNATNTQYSGLAASKEDTANKQTDLTASATKFPTVNAVNTGLATKEPTITAGTTSQYYRGDKTFQTLDKTAVGLSNVDNTSDANKPVSTAQATAIALKQNTLTLTTTGTSGAATLVGATLNIPQYSGGGGAASDYLSVLTSAEIAITTTATATINRQHLISGTSTNYTVTLPAVSGNTGRFVGIRISTSATRLFTIQGNASELIDGLNTRIMWAGESAILYCDGTGWKKIAGVSNPMICQRSLSAIQSTLFTTAAAVKVPLDRTDIDNTGLMADAGNNRIKFVRAGTYIMNGAVVFNGFTAIASRVITQLYVDTLPQCNSESSAVVGSYTTPFATTPRSFTTSNTISLYGYQNSGATQGCFGQSPNVTTFLSAIEIPNW